jgi:hypothetical protein
MAKYVLILFIFFNSFNSYSQFLGFGEEKKQFSSKIPGIIEKLSQLEIVATPQFESSFNDQIHDLEVVLDQDMLYCSGEAMGDKGKYISPDKKQVCIRELKQRYIEGVNLIFEIKKKYLALINEKHMESLSRIQKETLKSVESKF